MLVTLGLNIEKSKVVKTILDRKCIKCGTNKNISAWNLDADNNKGILEKLRSGIGRVAYFCADCRRKGNSFYFDRNRRIRWSDNDEFLFQLQKRITR